MRDWYFANPRTYLLPVRKFISLRPKETLKATWKEARDRTWRDEDEKEPLERHIEFAISKIHKEPFLFREEVEETRETSTWNQREEEEEEEPSSSLIP